MSDDKEKRALEAAEQASKAVDPGAPKRVGKAVWGFVKWLLGMLLISIIYIIVRILLS